MRNATDPVSAAMMRFLRRAMKFFLIVIPLLAALNVATAPRDTRRWRRAVSMAGASVVVMVLVAAVLVATRPRAPGGRDREG